MALEYAHGAIQWLTSDTLSTVKTVSGLSFQPKAIRLSWNGFQSATDAGTIATHGRRGVGFATSTSNRMCVVAYDADAAGTAVCASVRCVDRCVATITSTTLDGALDLNSITSDGFTLIVDDVAPANITVFWEAWGGDDITNAVCDTFSEPAATGNSNYVVPGTAFQPSVLMTAGVSSTAANGTPQAESSNLYIGYASSTQASDQVVAVGAQDHGSTTADTDHWGGHGACVANIALAGGSLSAKATLATINSDGFTLNWTDRATTGRESIYLAIKGGSWSCGDSIINGNTLNSTSQITGRPFDPKGISIIGCMTTEEAGTTTSTQDRLGWGMGSSTTSRRSMSYLSVDTPTAMEVCLNIQYDQVLSYVNAAGNVVTAYDIDSMDTGGLTLIVDLAGGVASEWFGFLIFGDDQPPGAGSAAVSFTATGGPVTSGGGTASVAFAPTAGGAADTTGAGTALVAFAATGIGASDFTGAGSSPVSFVATGVGAADATGVGAASVAFTATAEAMTGGLATVEFTVTGVPAVSGDDTGAGLATVAFTATAGGTADATGTGTATVSFTATAGGVADGTGVGTATVAFAGSGIGSADVTGGGTATATFSPTATGQSDATGAGTATVSFEAAGIPGGGDTGSGAASVAFAATGGGSADATTVGLASVSFTASGVGASDVAGTGAVSVSLSATGVGSADVTGSGAIAFTFVLTAGSAVDIAASGTVALSFVATGVGVADVVSSGNAVLSFVTTGFPVVRLPFLSTEIEGFTVTGVVVIGDTVRSSEAEGESVLGVAIAGDTVRGIEVEGRTWYSTGG